MFGVLTYSNNAFCQKKNAIKGEVIGKTKKDTILFVKGLLNEKYYQFSEISSEVVENKFQIKYSFSYPQMYFLSWKSEQNNIPFYLEPFFLDESTTKIIVSAEKNEVVGSSALEYTREFVPFVLNGTNIADINTYMFEEGHEFDFKLADYIGHKPDSFVALWVLINRFNENGYSKIYENSLDKFSDKIKSGKLWKVISEDIKKIRIRDGEKFPELILKDINLNSEKVILPEQKIILIDFWFSRCKPCLVQLPRLKEIYEKFAFTNKFDVVGISTDKTVNIDLWKTRIGENNLKWKNYLDENAFESNNEKITKFPTNFLLDINGVVIKKNISLYDLEEFLNENLK